jgi:hypothetical protein
LLPEQIAQKTRHVVFIVVVPRRYQATSTPQAFTISIYYFIIPYILDDYAVFISFSRPRALHLLEYSVPYQHFLTQVHPRYGVHANRVLINTFHTQLSY